MTKEELIDLASEGKAHIEAAYTMTRYRITPTKDQDCEAIFVSLEDADNSVHEDDEAYFIDGINEQTVTDAEAEILRETIVAAIN